MIIHTLNRNNRIDTRTKIYYNLNILIIFRSIYKYIKLRKEGYYMKKITQRFFMLGLSLLLLVYIGFIPVPATASDTNEARIYTDYSTFCSNKEYYENLAKNEGYTIYAYLGDEYSYSRTDSGNLITSDMARDFYIPSDTWDVVDSGTYTIDGYSNSDPLYTEYKFYGTKQYGVAIFNFSYDYTLGVSPKGFYEFGTYFTVEPRYMVFKYMRTYYESDEVYLWFSSPCDVNGYIGTYDAVSDLLD